MTKTQLSVRIAPDTLDRIDAEARRLGVSRGHVVDKWLSAQSAATSDAMPIEQQAWYRAGALVAKAQGRLGIAASEIDGDSVIGHLFVALSMALDAIDVLAGTAPEETQTVKYSISDGGTGQVFIGALRQVSATLDDLSGTAPD